MRMLFIHILIAVVSLGIALDSYFRPTRLKFYLNNFFALATLATGTLLVVTTDVSLGRFCFAGISYLLVVSILIWKSYSKLMYSKNR